MLIEVYILWCAFREGRMLSLCHDKYSQKHFIGVFTNIRLYNKSQTLEYNTMELKILTKKELLFHVL